MKEARPVDVVFEKKAFVEDIWVETVREVPVAEVKRRLVVVAVVMVAVEKTGLMET